MVTTAHRPAEASVVPPGPTVLDSLALLASVADDLALATTRDTHRAIADRVHGLLARGVGPLGMPAEVLHKGIAAGVYGAIGVSLRGTSAGLDRIADAGVGPRLEEGPRGRFLAAAVNGLIGDELFRERPQFAFDMTVRHGDRDVAVARDALDAAFPGATGRLVIFLHGLCENEAYWNLHRERTGGSYGAALAGHGWTPVFLRYNTGISVRRSGAALASLLEQLVAEWPVPVEQIALVGHSMGGLVSRAATAVVHDSGEALAWTERLTDVVTLGAPHLGSPVAKAAHTGSRLLGVLPESAAFSERILERRSEGIRDLTEGLAHEVPPLEHVHYRLVAATLTRSARHVVGAAVGDLLVRPTSAVGRDRRGRELFPGSHKLHVGRTDHFGLLNHPEVLAALERWLA
jgi:pimeloyl-ACP methyl ester carboxylesterase